MTTDKRTCEWVRDWLPLLAGDGERVAGQSGDVSAEDRRLLEGHLDVCTSCRRRRTALEGALSLLDVVEAQPPVGREGVSVWPDLEGRMRRYHERERSRWMRVLRGYCPEGLRAAADWLRRGWEEVHAQLPFRVAWARDSAREFLESRGRVPQAIPAAGQVFPLDVLLPRLAVGLGLAFLLLLSIVPLVHRHQARAEAQIALNAVPIPGASIPPSEPFEAGADADGRPEAETRPADSLAQADPPTVADAPVTGQGQGSPAPARPSATASAAPRYDLDYGIPMTPDSRGNRPAY